MHPNLGLALTEHAPLLRVIAPCPLTYHFEQYTRRADLPYTMIHHGATNVIERRRNTMAQHIYLRRT
jgi:hypothetical protein